MTKRKITPRRRSASAKLPTDIRLIGHLERPEVLASTTYAIQPNDGVTRNDGRPRTIYITVSDHRVEGEIRPFEIFINGADASGFPSIQFTARMLSSRFQEPGPFPVFLIEELKETFDTTGGYLVSEPWLRPKGHQRMAASVLAHIGLVLEFHWKKLQEAKAAQSKTPDLSC